MMKTLLASPILSFYVIIFCGFRMQQHGLSHAQCLDSSEALLQVSYNDASWRDHEFVKIRVTESSPKMGSTEMEEMKIKLFPTNATFTFEKCIPRDDTCGHIMVIGPTRDFYEISWDGKSLGIIAPELPAKDYVYNSDVDSDGFVTSVQFGDACVPECDSVHEAQLELQVRIANYLGEYNDDDIYSDMPLPLYFLLEDQNGNAIISTNDDLYRYTMAGLYANRMCIPKNECYRLVMRDVASNDVEHLAVSFDGTKIFDYEPFYFKSVSFGNECTSSSKGVSGCDPDKESSVQFFSYDKGIRVSWQLALATHDLDSEPQIIYTGDMPAESSSILRYNEICVPKQTCLTFSMKEEIQKDKNKEGFSTYRVRNFMVIMDDIIYKYQGSISTSHDNMDTFYVGDCGGKMPSICNPINETLLELSFLTKPRPSSSDPEFPLNSGWNSFWGVFGLVENENEEGGMIITVQETLVTAKEFRYFETESQYDSTYRVIKCIPNTKCFYSLVIEDDPLKSIFYESHSIKVDDTISNADTVHYFDVEGLQSDMEGTQIYATAIDDCEGSSVSGGAIDGITIALLIVFVAGALMSIFVIRMKAGGKRITYENIHAVQEIEMTDKD